MRKAGKTLLLKNARVLNVFTGAVEKGNVLVQGDIIKGIGDYTKAAQVIDLSGKYLLPGLIDAHIHIESTLLTPAGFAAAALPHGTTAVVADPHEIVNVAGLEGLEYMVEASRELPLDVFYMMPSCVPATPLETGGAVFGLKEIRKGWRMHPESPGLAEMMDFPGVYLRDPAVLAKVEEARERGKVIDGHAPLLSGEKLQLYVAAGISTDHECSTAKEALEKIGLGMKILIREGSAAKNLTAILPAVNDKTAPFFMFCTDDRHPEDLLREGHMDNILRRAVYNGLDPVLAVRMATLNTAHHYGLRGRGAVAPGYRADLVVVEDLENFNVEAVFKGGRLVAHGGKNCESSLPAGAARALIDKARQLEGTMARTVRTAGLEGRLALPARPAGEARARVIEVYPDQILTGSLLVPAGDILAAGKKAVAGIAAPDIAKAVVAERHGKNGNVAVGLVKGFGPLQGALVSTVAHDSHNLVAVGTSDADIALAARAVAETGGGLAVAGGGKVLALMALPVAGLMSPRGAEHASFELKELHQAAREIGCILPAPFMTLSFLSLPVIPSLKITDRGLIDADRLKIVPLWV